MPFPHKLPGVQQAVELSRRVVCFFLSHEIRFNDQVAGYCFAQLLDAVDHCHSRGVCHRDIQPENIQLDAHGNVKLAGFALAGIFKFDPSAGDSQSSEKLLYATHGIPSFAAPEVKHSGGWKTLCIAPR